MENSKRAERKKQEDLALTRALIWFAAAMVVEFLLLLVNKFYINFTADTASIQLAIALKPVLKVTAVLGLLGAVLSGLWGWKQVKAAGALPFLCLVLTTVLLAVGFGSALIVVFYRAAVQLLCVLVPAGAVLALVYYLYQKEFFFSACSVGVGLLGLWLVRKGDGAHELVIMLYAVAGVLVLLTMILLALKLKKSGGVLTIKETQLAVLPKQSDNLSIILSCVASLLALLAGVLLGSTAAFYLMFVLVAWLFVLLVYYTVKMM